MRDSFFHLKEWYMTTERPEDFERVRDYVVEQTRMVSMEQLGVDLTRQNTGDFQSARNMLTIVCWRTISSSISGRTSNSSVLHPPACLLVAHVKTGD